MPRSGENAMKNIAPERCGIIALTATSRVTAHAASTARRCTARQPFPVICSAGAAYWPPALLTRVSIRPNRSSVLSTSPATCSSSRMSAGTASARAPSASISAAVFSNGSGRLPQITTSAPQRAN